MPIAFAYFVAHFFTLFVFQSQDLWAMQVTAIVIRHVPGLVCAHDRALELGRTHREALTSQIPMLLL